MLRAAASRLRGLAFTPDGASLIAVGGEVSRWQGEPLVAVEHQRIDPAPEPPAIGGSDLVVTCAGGELCVLRHDALSVRRRLRCPEGSSASSPRVSDDGAWIAALCGNDAVVSTCVWAHATFRRLRCMDTGQLPHHAQPFSFRPETGELAVSSPRGFESWRPPTFATVATVDAETEMDANILMSWLPSTRGLLVVSSYGGTLHALDGEGETREFAILGPHEAHAWSPDGTLLAIAYAEQLALHEPNGAVSTRRSARSSPAAVVRWSSDSRFVAVEWAAEEEAGFDVYARDGLRHVLAVVADGADSRVPSAWHPTTNLVAYPSGEHIELQRVAP